MITNYKFLPDQPLKAEKELQNANFGHRDIAETLVGIIKCCKSPFSIALDGKWGSGKSSIANVVQEKLKNQGDFSVVYFDIWKYEGDALRRSFLKEAVAQLKDGGLQKSFELNERLYNSVTIKSEGNVTLNKGKTIIKQFWKPVTIGLGIIALVTVIFKYGGWFPEYWDGWKKVLAYAGQIAGISSIASLVSIFFLKIVPQIITTETKTYGTDRFTDPHEFENEFGSLLTNLQKNKLLIIFDNLDRVTHDKALEVLSTIKTFLEPKDIQNTTKEVFYLIPCDIEAIKEHVKSVYAPKNDKVSTAFNPDEFLRKFFNTIITIPEFILTELEDFTKKLLKETDVPDFNDDTVAWLISKTFRENPRQIKQFINSLLASYLLVQERKTKQTLGEADITVPQLAKFLIIKSKYNECLEELKKLKEWNLENLSLDILKNKVEFRQFLADTNHVPINNLQILLTFKHSEQEQRLPGFELFTVALKDKNTPEAEKFISNIPNFEDVKQDFTQAVKGICDSTANKDSIFSIISTLLPILHGKSLKLDGYNGYDIFANFLSSEKIEYLRALEPAVVFNQILESTNATYKNQIIEKFLQILEKQGSGVEDDVVKAGYGYAIVEQIAKHTEWFVQKAPRVQAIITKFYPNYPQLIKLFSENGAVKKDFISSAFIQSYIGSITTEEIDGNEKSRFEARVENLKFLDKDTWDLKVTVAFISKASELVSLENAKEINPQQLSREGYLLNKFDELFKSFPDALFNAKEGIAPLITGLVQGVNAIPDWNNRKIYVPILSTLRPYAGQEVLPQIDSIVSGFIADESIKAEALDYVNSKIGESWLAENSSHIQNLRDRAISDMDIFRWYYPKVKISAQVNLLKGLVESSVDNFIKIVTEFKFVLPDNKAVVESVLQKLTKKIGAVNRSNLYNICNQLKCGEDEPLQAKYNQHLIDSVKSDDKEIQVAAVKGFDEADYLSEEQKRKTVKDIVTWLGEKGTPPYQPECTRVVTKNWRLLDTQLPKKAEFIQFVFDKLLIEATNLESINLGYEILAAIKPFGRDQRTLLDDLRQHIIDTSDPVISAPLKDGLMNLKDASGIPDADEFWDIFLGRVKEKVKNENSKNQTKEDPKVDTQQ